LTRSELCRTAAAVAVANHLPVVFFVNLIQQESGFRPHVVSPAGAEGIAQFMPRVAASYGLENSFEPIAALTASGRLLAEFVAQFGNLGLAAAAYNAGPRRVQEWLASRGYLPAETRHYVYSITGRPAEYWAQAVRDSGLRHPMNARCAETMTAQGSEPVTAGLHNVPVVASMASAFSIAGVGASTRPDKLRSFAVRRSMPQPSQFAIGRPVSRLVKLAEQRYLQRSARAKANSRRQPAMDRFLAMATPVIMAQERR
jgi:hypothetical protein